MKRVAAGIYYGCGAVGMVEMVFPIAAGLWPGEKKAAEG